MTTKTKTKPASSNPFATAVESKPGAKKASDARAIKDVDGLLEYASICAVEDAFESLKATYKEKINAQQVDEFVKEGVAHKKRPPTFKGVDGVGEALLILGKRNTRSPLDEVQVALLKEYGVTGFQEEVEYAFNPECLTDELREKIGAALAKVPGIPANLFKVSRKVVVTNDALDQVFHNKPVVAKQLLEIVGTLVIKPKIVEDFADTVKRVGELLKAEGERSGATVQ